MTATLPAGIADLSARTIRLFLAPEVISTSVPAVRRDIRASLSNTSLGDHTFERLELDLSRTSRLDSMGLNLLFEVVSWGLHHDLQVRLEGAGDGIEGLLRKTRLDRLAEIAPKSA